RRTSPRPRPKASGAARATSTGATDAPPAAALAGRGARVLLRPREWHEPAQGAHQASRRGAPRPHREARPERGPRGSGAGRRGEVASGARTGAALLGREPRNGEARNRAVPALRRADGVAAPDVAVPALRLQARLLRRRAAVVPDASRRGRRFIIAASG